MLLGLFFGMPGLGELLVVGAIVLLVFGGRRLPELAKSLGRSIVEFKDGLTGAGDGADVADQGHRSALPTESSKTDTPKKQ